MARGRTFNSLAAYSGGASLREMGGFPAWNLEATFPNGETPPTEKTALPKNPRNTNISCHLPPTFPEGPTRKQHFTPNEKKNIVRFITIIITLFASVRALHARVAPAELDTFFVSSPPVLTRSAFEILSFDSIAPNGLLRYEGQLDGAGFTEVPAVVVLSGLSDGPHTYEVRAVDAAGNVDSTPASISWTVDANAPDTFITVGPSGTTSNTSAEIYFDGDDVGGSGVASFEGSLDGAPYTPMNSPAFYAVLSEGEHTFSVRAIDRAGNVDPTPASITWTVNTIPPNNPPTDITLSNDTIAENNAPGATIGTLSATDADEGDTHTFSFAESAQASAPAPGGVAFITIGGNDNANFTITGNVLSINDSADFETKSSYNVRIKVTDSGNPTASYEKDFTITITDVTIPQEIAFDPLGGKTFGDADFTVSATGGDSGEPVTFTASGAATVTGDLVHITGAGSVTITAHQAGAGDYSAAADVEQTFTVAQAAQTITFAPAANAEQADAVTLTATGGASGNAVTFTLVDGPGVLDGDSLTFTGDGDVVVRASQAGNDDYLAAPDVEATITVGTPSNLPAVDDAVTLTTGDATVYPLANDGNPNATIVSVNTGLILESFPGPGLALQPVESGVIIDGRKLIVPADFSEPSFTYTTSDGYTATVRVFTDRPVVGARRFAGLLHDLDGKIAGIMQASSSSNGTFLSTLKIGARTVIAKFQLTAGTKTVTTSFGSLTITRDEYGRLVVTLDNGETAFTGNLRPCKNTAAIAQHNVALASIHEAIPGGGYIQAFTKLNGDIILVGKLPDGRPFSAKSRLADNGTFAIYNSINSTAPKGYCAGELVAVNLVKTDLTGELVWTMPAQARSPHATGVDTVLTANGCVFTPGATLSNGPCTIVVSGGNLAASSSIASTITAGSPAANALVTFWRVRATKGSFTAIVKDPARTKAVGARGIYLPKSNSAWGYFPGTSVGGRIELTQSQER